ncbi:MAG: serine/threonine protein kinase [Planctomycetaceae bacterium]|nr:serine/threonine protein kinase [Planctomycetaceae bacterium]
MTEPSDLPTDSTEAENHEATVRTLGDFRLLRKLGQGGMAEVWLAEQVSLSRRVALKLLKQELMREEKYVSRFQREASAAGGLNHPNIAQVHTVGEAEGQHYIAQEYVKGMTLKQFLRKKGPPELPFALHIIRQVASALKAAADAGIVHRDIKPENIMLTGKGEVKVADFGLAQLYGPGEGVDITQEGMTMGTPLYMSPEQIHGQKLDPRSDLYSLGVTCYHMLTGRPPFEGANAMAIAVKHIHEEPTPLGNLRPDLPKPVIQIVDRMLRKEPNDRYQSAGNLLADVRRVQKAVRGATSVEEIELANAPVAQPVQSGRGQLSRRTAIGLTATLFVLAGAVSAGVGWVTRPVDPLTVPPRPSDETIVRKGSAQEQFIHAMVLANNEDAFLEVLTWQEKSDREWVRKAEEQLALMYLQDPDRWSDAEAMLTTIESYASENERYKAEALAGRAALLAYQGAHQQSRNIQDSQLASLQEKLPPQSPFRRLLNEARHLTDQNRNNSRGPSKPPAGPAP